MSRAACSGINVSDLTRILSLLHDVVGSAKSPGRNANAARYRCKLFADSMRTMQGVVGKGGPRQKTRNMCLAVCILRWIPSSTASASARLG